MLRTVRRHARRVLSACTLVLVVAPAAYATDCNVNVYQAYEKAKARGWTFACRWDLPGAKSTLLPFGDTIGCVIDTPALPWPSTSAPYMQFFALSGGLKNGWTVKGYEITGAQWTKAGWSNAYVKARFGSLQPAKKYQTKISRLTLSKSGGVCSNAIDEAF